MGFFRRGLAVAVGGRREAGRATADDRRTGGDATALRCTGLRMSKNQRRRREVLTRKKEEFLREREREREGKREGKGDHPS